MKLVRFLQLGLKRKSLPSCQRIEANTECFMGSAPLTRLGPPYVLPIFRGGFDPIKRSGQFFGSLASLKETCRRNSKIATERPNDASIIGSPVAIEVEDVNSLLAARIEAEIPPMHSTLGFIFKVPKKARIVGEDTYDPRIISIGPYHHANKSFKLDEKHKKWYLDSFISRMSTRKANLPDFIKAIRELEVNARAYYAEPINLTSDQFVRMMILDSCFILELFNKYVDANMNIETKDILFRTTWIVPTVRRDLLLLENQIPFFVLECLFNLTKSPKQSLSLNELVTNFFKPIFPNFQNTQTNPSIKSKHILDLLRSHLLHTSGQMKYAVYPLCEYTPSATELSYAGVKFKRKDMAHGLLDITFKNGVLEIPPFTVGVSWTVLLPNLVALEQCRHEYKDKITSYVILMDSLIDTHSDVKLLRDKGIIDKLFKEDEKVALAINCLYKLVVVHEFYYDGLCRQVNAYTKTDWNRWRATLMREYFNTPWAALQVLAATVLLILTIIQTFPTILDFPPIHSWSLLVSVCQWIIHSFGFDKD